MHHNVFLCCCRAFSSRLQFSSFQSLDQLGHQGDMRVNSAEILFQSFLQETLVSSSGVGRDVPSLMLSIWHFLCKSLFTPCSLCVHFMFTVCSLPVHFVFISCSLCVHSLFTKCSLHAHYVLTPYSLCVHSMFTMCSLHAHYVFTHLSLLSSTMPRVEVFIGEPCMLTGDCWELRFAAPVAVPLRLE